MIDLHNNKGALIIIMLARIILLTVALVMSLQAKANEQCQAVKFGIVDWTDVRVTTAVAEVLLEKLDYKVDVSEHSVDSIYSQLSQGKIDAFLGNWMPTMEPIIKPYQDKKLVETLGMNLSNAKYTLAVPAYVYEAGVKSFADLAKFKKEFGGRIYGLEKGNDGNLIIQQMIDKNEFGLGTFNLLATSERIMLAQVKKRVRENQWIAFLAWTPHPMNNQFDIRYLDGGDQYFGPNYGGSTVHTNVRSGFATDCPNVNRLLKNLVFSVEMEGVMMNQVLNEFVPADRAVRDWMYKNPKQVSSWLRGVKTRTGQAVNSVELANSLKLTFDN